MGRNSFTEIVAVVDRLVVDSAEWRSPRRGYDRLGELFERVAVSDLAYRRTLPWRERLAGRWPGIGRVKRLDVTGPPRTHCCWQGGCAPACAEGSRFG